MVCYAREPVSGAIVGFAISAGTDAAHPSYLVIQQGNFAFAEPHENVPL